MKKVGTTYASEEYEELESDDSLSSTEDSDEMDEAALRRKTFLANNNEKESTFV